MDEAFVEVAAAIAREAGELLVAYCNRGVICEEKGAFDVVTGADRAAEQYIVCNLRQRFPDHAILAEESGLHQAGRPYRWIVDPLDGTKNFVRRNPVFAVTLALEKESETIAGVVFDPLRNELLSAETGSGAFLNGSRICVGSAERLQDALVSTGFPSGKRHAGMDLRFFELLARSSQGLRRSGSTALDLAYVAAGRLDAFWEVQVELWDLAAGVLLIREAGGTVSKGEAGEVFAANPVLHGLLKSLYENHGPGPAA